MKKISMGLISVFLTLGLSNCFAKTLSIVEQNKSQNIQIFSVANANGAITAKSIEKAFNSNNVIVDVNNDMNSIFSKRYGHIHHEKYNLAIFNNDKLLSKLIKKYPNIGLITPLSMSIYSNDAKKTINISTLSLQGMSRITKIPVTDTDLINYAKLIDNALHKALPNGKYLLLNHNTKSSNKPLTTEFTTKFELEDDATIQRGKR